jgi:hypothetical protein
LLLILLLIFVRSRSTLGLRAWISFGNAGRHPNVSLAAPLARLIPAKALTLKLVEEAAERFEQLDNGRSKSSLFLHGP